jgi:hypothetical protein
MSDQELNLFLVEGKSSNSWMSRMINYGDNYGERYAFAEVVVAKSSDEAIGQVWDRKEKRCNEYQEKAKRISAEVEALREAGKTDEADQRLDRATGFFGGEISPIPPSAPRDREEWRASEVKVEGYRIKVEPET